MKHRKAIAALACLAFAPVAAAAQIDGIDGARMMALVAAAGHEDVGLSKDSEGDPMVTATLDGVTYQVFMYDCHGGSRCTSIQFTAGFDLADGTTLATLNDWNRRTRFANAWRDDEDDPWLELDLDLEAGTTEAQVVEYIELWEHLLAEFRQQIGFGAD